MSGNEEPRTRINYLRANQGPVFSFSHTVGHTRHPPEVCTHARVIALAAVRAVGRPGGARDDPAQRRPLGGTLRPQQPGGGQGAYYTQPGGGQGAYYTQQPGG
eukprot:6689740-Pyramimonas_sp.AAC.1